jgi:hypothetical protein
MPLPLTSNIEIPILQELVAVGGSDDVRFLYQRLISYFPSLSDGELFEIRNNANRKWRERRAKSRQSSRRKQLYSARARFLANNRIRQKRVVSLETTDSLSSKPEADLFDARKQFSE